MTKFIPVSSLQDADDIEIEHFIPKHKNELEAYDIKFKKNIENVGEIDVPAHLIKKLIEKLQEACPK